MPKGLAPVYRRTGDSLSTVSVQTAQELQVVLEPRRCWDCTLDFTEQLRPRRQRLAQRFDLCESVAHKMASGSWDDGACLQPHCLAGWYGFSGQ